MCKQNQVRQVADCHSVSSLFVLMSHISKHLRIDSGSSQKRFILWLSMILGYLFICLFLLLLEGLSRKQEIELRSHENLSVERVVLQN